MNSLQVSPPAPSPEARAAEFVPVSGGQEATSAGGLLVVAYLVLWALLFGFIFVTWRKQRQLETKLNQLHREIEKATPRSPSD